LCIHARAAAAQLCLLGNSSCQAWASPGVQQPGITAESSNTYTAVLQGSQLKQTIVCTQAVVLLCRSQS
jgi:hypothetical protein